MPPFDAGFGVYIHWPFCQAKCPYCDFNSHVRRAGIDEARYVAAFAREIAHMAALAPGRTVGSVFFGGGTPSLMKPATVGAILDAIGRHWPIAADCEVTLEANPTSVEAGRFAGYRAAGVNRVSLGVQSLVEADLKALGRLHTVGEALVAVGIAAKLFERFSFDLIYARPGQTPDAWREELVEALAHAPTHLSLYQLTIEPGTAYAALHAAGKLHVPDADRARELYDVTQDICSKFGMPAYEVSNHARPGEECRHNLLYWRYGEYAGIGPGAHGRLVTARGRRAFVSERAPEAWLDYVERDGHGIVTEEVLAREDEADEFLLMGLRLREGIDPKRFEALAGRRFDHARVADLAREGLIETCPDGRLRVAPAGFPVLDAIVADLAAS
ncbi:MAG: radical SAM family heme chaperone HemW [Hyphomicrobiales bacterium]|uniref:radical SAM family heme chaperone HemW n=1 Tax=Rhabdaerophilum calidifontis TaxID=2604328 RepID=UPI001FE658D6|nr:radical SAM family heme chaperone HemW [Rhabdaerophilum calidifontis]MCA1953012.1 radical SAM family heme chaperone HemW [Hyphomicrobiales bacterium]